MYVEDEPELFGECFGEGWEVGSQFILASIFFFLLLRGEGEDLLGTRPYFSLFCDGEDNECRVERLPSPDVSDSLSFFASSPLVAVLRVATFHLRP
jgi:hypothetical protein